MATSLPESGAEAPAMSTVDQAAIVLLSMGEEPAAAVLRCLGREELLLVTQAMSAMSGIKVDAARGALQRFFDDYREQSGLHGASRTFLKNSLDLALGSSISSSVLTRIYGDAIRPKMARLQWASPRWVADRIAQEHVHMQAVFLAFLPPAMASEVIASLPEDGRDELIVRVAQLGHVEHRLLQEVEVLADACLQSLETQSATIEGVKHAADILNRLPGDKARMVEQLRARDAGVAGQIERSMYDFFILSRQSEEVLLRILEVVPMDEWAIALKGGDSDVRRALMACMPQRQVKTFQDAIRRTGPVAARRVEEARATIMREVKALADAGTIEVQLYAEATVE